MKILIISHMYPSNARKVNGVFVHEQVKELINQGHEVRVVSPVPFVPPFFKFLSSKWKAYSDYLVEDKFEGIRVYYPGYLAIPKNINFHTSGTRMYLGIKNIIKKIYKDFKFDILHAHVALPDGYAAMKISEDYNVPFITTIHGMDLQHTIFRDSKCKNNIKKVLSQSQKNILVSSKLNKIRKENFPNIDNKKFVVINNGVSKLFLNKDKTIRITTNKNIRILSVSNLIKTKGIDLNIKAMSAIAKLYPRLSYQIIGDGPEKDTLESLVRELKLDNNVFFVGAKSREEVKKYMCEADIFLLPSWNEAFGVVYIEAMSCGIPVIGCLGEGIEDIVTDGKDGLLVKPKDIDDIVRKTLYIINNPSKRKEMGIRARDKVIVNFTWEIVANQISNIYREVCR
ncbi:glycosyltransferase [Bacillus sp. CMF12]|uniref:glycosyltransferase n=1 Tax=Bacillus sp. CMF12 TaxID=2884834 RepID=UPI00207922B6|nr:glycosyltransferase [Bacillus sp. CMF12]USK49618.1 glycosyltransferase [Bacillus sp. CMF12]